ncbi:MAG: hypothetical protein AAGI23_04570 [Bacteroidota bacterium]
MRWTFTFVAVFFMMTSLVSQSSTTNWAESKQTSDTEEVALDINVLSDGIELFWEVSLEQQIASYEVQRAVDGRPFEKIAWFAASGEGETGGAYLHLDQDYFEQEALQYRIKINKTDGQVAYSLSQHVDLQLSRPCIRLSENVQPRFVALDDEGLDAEKDIELLDSSGNIVMRLDCKSEKLEMNTQSLRQGVYYLKMVLADGENQIAKIVKP